MGEPPSLPPRDEHNAGPGDGGRHLHIHGPANLSFHQSDLHGLTELAKVDPEAARMAIEKKDASERRAHGSYRASFGMTIGLLVVLIVAATVVLVFSGLLTLIGLTMFIMASALLVRVVITGDWSDTSWLGQMASKLIRAGGGAPRAKDEDGPGGEA